MLRVKVGKLKISLFNVRSDEINMDVGINGVSALGEIEEKGKLDLD